MSDNEKEVLKLDFIVNMLSALGFEPLPSDSHRLALVATESGDYLAVVTGNLQGRPLGSSDLEHPSGCTFHGARSVLSYFFVVLACH